MEGYNNYQNNMYQKPGPTVPEKSPGPMSTQQPSFQTAFASLSLHQYDRIRLLGFPPEITNICRQLIPRAWPKGIQDERLYAGSHEFKFRGNPWYGKGDEAMHARRLMRAIFESLWNAGWLMTLSTDVSKKQTDKDTLIFRYQPPPPPCDWLTISFSRYDRIRVMDAPQDVRDAIIAELRPNMQESAPYTAVPGTWEIKMRGNPWYATGEETMYARILLLKLMTVLERFGFTVYASIDQKATVNENRSESDTWHCRRSKDWMPGAPVFHQ